MVEPPLGYECPWHPIAQKQMFYNTPKSWIWFYKFVPPLKKNLSPYLYYLVIGQ